MLRTSRQGRERTRPIDDIDGHEFRRGGNRDRSAAVAISPSPADISLAAPITVEEMAAAEIRASSFPQRFKAVTTMSPLRYQKALRLQEARRLMLFQKMDASDACYRICYLSASQFTREYGRFFGSVPSKDILWLREQGFASNAADR